MTRNKIDVVVKYKREFTRPPSNDIIISRSILSSIDAFFLPTHSISMTGLCVGTFDFYGGKICNPPTTDGQYSLDCEDLAYIAITVYRTDV